MFKKIITLASSIALLSLTLVGCSPSDTSSSELDKITIAEVTHSVFYAPQYAAITQGFFEEEGIEIDLINTPGADKTMAALISEEAQIGLMGPEASIYVYNQGNEDYAVNFAQLTNRDGSFLISREEIPDFTYDDLKGKEVLGGRKGGMPLMTLEYLLKNEELTIGEDVENDEVNVRTDVAFNVMVGAFAGGEGDFTTAFEPTASQMVKDGTGHIVASIGADSGDIPFTAYCATSSYLSENEDLIQRFTNAVYKGQKWVMNSSSEDVAKSMQPFFEDIALEDLIVVVDNYKEIDAFATNPTLSEESFNNAMDVIEEAGELNERVPYEDLVNTDFSENAKLNLK